MLNLACFFAWRNLGICATCVILMNFAQPSFCSSWWTSTLFSTYPHFKPFCAIAPPQHFVCVPSFSSFVVLGLCSCKVRNFILETSWVSYRFDSSKGKECWIQGFKLDLFLLRSSSCTSGSLAELSTAKDKCLRHGQSQANEGVTLYLYTSLMKGDVRVYEHRRIGSEDKQQVHFRCVLRTMLVVVFNVTIGLVVDAIVASSRRSDQRRDAAVHQLVSWARCRDWKDVMKCQL